MIMCMRDKCGWNGWSGWDKDRDRDWEGREGKQKIGIWISSMRFSAMTVRFYSSSEERDIFIENRWVL